MVRALLAGTKTQTRRIAKVRRDINIGCEIAPSEYAAEARAGNFENLPYAPGDRLWVRENVIIAPKRWTSTPTNPMGPDRQEVVHVAEQTEDTLEAARDYKLRITPSIHMPRWASRLTLIVSDVRVQRLCEISEDDAKAEGASFHDGMGIGHSGWRHDLKDVHDTAQSSFARLWNEINGPDAWKANPWVIAVSFTVHKSNIDALEREKAA
jgi:hypothetical protein